MSEIDISNTSKIDISPEIDINMSEDNIEMVPADVFQSVDNSLIDSSLDSPQFFIDPFILNQSLIDPFFIDPYFMIDHSLEFTYEQYYNF